MKILSVSLLLLLSGCVAGVEETVSQADKAELVELESTLTKGARAQATYFVEEGVYTFDVNALDLDVPAGVAIAITQQSNQDYCMTGTHEELDSVIYHVSTDQTVPTEGPC